jgi:hypothetical protein
LGMVSWARAQQTVGECNVPSSAGLARQEPEAESDAVSGSESDSEPGASADAGAPTAESTVTCSNPLGTVAGSRHRGEREVEQPRVVTSGT